MEQVGPVRTETLLVVKQCFPCCFCATVRGQMCTLGCLVWKACSSGGFQGNLRLFTHLHSDIHIAIYILNYLRPATHSYGRGFYCISKTCSILSRCSAVYNHRNSWHILLPRQDCPGVKFSVFSPF